MNAETLAIKLPPERPARMVTAARIFAQDFGIRLNLVFPGSL